MAIAVGQPGGRPISVAGQPGQALAAAADRGGQHHHVLHRPGQADADHQPDQARHVAELDRQHRPDQRPRPRDRREVVAEEHPAVRRVEVLAVVESMRRRDPRVVERRDPGRQERAVVAIGDGQDRQDAEHHRHRVDGHRGFDPREETIATTPRGGNRPATRTLLRDGKIKSHPSLRPIACQVKRRTAHPANRPCAGKPAVWNRTCLFTSSAKKQPFKGGCEARAFPAWENHPLPADQHTESTDHESHQADTTHVPGSGRPT